MGPKPVLEVRGIAGRADPRDPATVPGDERRAAIVKAVLPLFARQGFSNTTTRQLAEAAGVSEALLYKHFPSKDGAVEWGTDDARAKGGDYFGAKDTPSPWAP